MRVLVTGSGGFLGSHLCKALGAHQVTGIVSAAKNVPGALALDLTAPLKDDIVPSLIGKFDAIIHLASVMCSKENARDFELLSANQMMARNLITLGLALKPKHFIHVSSIAVYPSSDGTYTEDSLVNPSANGDALYGLAKYNAEVLFDFYLGQQMTVTHLRPSQIYGPGMREDRIIPVLLKELKEQKAITLLGGGERVANFVHVEDVVQAIVKALEHPVAGVFNVACATHLSLAQVAKQLIAVYGDEGCKINLLEQGSRVRQYIAAEKLNQTWGLRLTKTDFTGIGGY